MLWVVVTKVAGEIAHSKIAGALAWIGLLLAENQVQARGRCTQRGRNNFAINAKMRASRSSSSSGASGHRYLTKNSARPIMLGLALMVKTFLLKMVILFTANYRMGQFVRYRCPLAPLLEEER